MNTAPRRSKMAKVAVDQRTNALKNPLATFNDKALTIDDVLNSRMIVDPLHLFEIVSPVSGGAAIIVASPEVAKRAKNPPVWLLGAGEYANHSTITYAPSITDLADRSPRPRTPSRWRDCSRRTCTSSVRTTATPSR